MKTHFKNFIFFVAFAISSLVGNAQTIEVQGSKTHDFYPESSGFTDCYMYLKNVGTGSLRIAYEKVSVDYPAGWDVSFCDNRNCFFTFRDKDTFTALAPGEKASIKITVFPKGAADTAVVKYAVWDVNNPSVKDTLTFNIMVRWSAGAHFTCMPQQAIYPVPANRHLQVNTLGVNYIEIRSTSGQKITQYFPDAEWTRLDISELLAGSYVVLLKGQNGIRSYNFLKN
ncbi:MAG: T9SS C-terminal target domain-containing protein [Bacteroidetes bacterium]|nr:T9SS C-terminal target domain-containing protein [Bacteroidota bacterium]